MKIPASFAAAMALANSALAGPVKRQQYSINDADILNYALTLEHLEDNFYREGVANFTASDFEQAGYGASFYENLKEISYDETTHVSFLTSALQAAGATPVQQCKYDFPITDVHSFVATAAVLEGVGVTAYLGAAASITSKTYLTVAGSILTVESRHNAYLRAAMEEHPAPQAFDAPLDFNEVYTLAAPFFVSCPSSNPSFLPLKAFPSLAVISTGTVLTGSSITVSAQIGSYSGPIYAAFVSVTGPVWAPVTPWGAQDAYTVTIPAGVHGQSYLLLTKSSTSATDDSIVAGPAIVMISGTDGAPTVP